MKLLFQLGEDRIVAELIKALPGGPDVRVAAGDDCAVLGRPRDRFWRLLKTDAVVEGVHFSADEKMDRVGWKALCRAISDIAAMGGKPEQAVITLAISSRRELKQAKDLYAGLSRAARAYGVAIVGGETCRSPGPLFVSVALTGRVRRTRCVLRSGGKPGDALYVTGRFGGSLSGHHLDFKPRLKEARWLAKRFPPHAMMDVSDGLAADLPRLAAASGCGFELWEASVPRRPRCSIAQALNDGEDFELLFALPQRKAAVLEKAWKAKFPRVRLTRIGALTRLAESKPLPLTSKRGYDHFAHP